MATSGGMKAYRTVSSAKRALADAGLHGLARRFDKCAEDGGDYYGAPVIKPVLLCELREDVDEVRSRGFAAELKA